MATKILPEVLFSSYRAYKSDTAFVLDWISKSAEKCKSYAQQTSQSEGGNVRVSVVLSQVAHIVASKEPVIQVPEHIIHAAKRAVSVRKSCYNWFQRQQNKSADDSLSDESHWAFIEVLEEIVEKLSRHSAFQSTSMSVGSQESSSKSTGPTALSNLFSHLNLEEPLESLMDEGKSLPMNVAPWNEKQTSTRSSTAIPESVTTESPMDAVLFLYNDLKQLRANVQRQWSEFASGKADLLSVSVVTNAALVLARQLEEEVNSAIPASNSAAKTLEILQIKPDETELGKISPSTRESMYLQTFKHLSSIAARLPNSSSSSFSTPDPLKPGEYDPARELAEMSEVEQSDEDSMVLNRLLPQVGTFMRPGKLTPAQDEITLGVQKFVKDKEISVWLTFATQIFLDIMHLTRPNMMKALDGLRKMGTHILDTLKEYLDSLSEEYVKVKQEQVLRMRHLMDIVHNWVPKEKAPKGKGKSKASISSEQSRFLYQHHPLFCGIIATNLTLELHSITASEAEERGLVRIMHLYNAIRYHRDYQVDAWPDMDLAIAVDSEQNLFFGEAPRGSMQLCMSRYLLLRNVPITGYASDARETTTKQMPKEDRRKLKKDSAVVQLLHSAYVDKDPIQTATAKMQHHLLPKGQESVEPPQPSEWLDPSLLQAQPQRKRKANQKKGRGKAPKPTPDDAAPDREPQVFGPDAFLANLRTAVEEEVPALLIDYVALRDAAQTFVEALQQSVGPAMATKLKMVPAINIDIRTCANVSHACTVLLEVARNTEMDMQKGATSAAATKTMLRNEFMDPVSAAATRVVRAVGDRELGRLRGLLEGTGAGDVLEGLVASVSGGEAGMAEGSLP